jgi:hypothetical protein
MRFALVLMVGCAVQRVPTAADNPTRIVDSTGAEFGWVCDHDGCSVAPTVDGYVAEINGADRNYVIVGAHWFKWERIVACNVDADCPQLYIPNGTGDWFTCRQIAVARSTVPSGLCERVGSKPLKPIDTLDVQVLCQSALARPQTFDSAADFNVAVQIDDLVTTACGTTNSPSCTLPLPAPCLQPM